MEEVTQIQAVIALMQKSTLINNNGDYKQNDNNNGEASTYEIKDASTFSNFVDNLIHEFRSFADGDPLAYIVVKYQRLKLYLLKKICIACITYACLRVSASTYIYA